MTAAEHFDWAVGRAMVYVEAGDGATAMASLVSDLREHEGTAKTLNGLTALFRDEVANDGAEGARRFIAGLPRPVTASAGQPNAELAYRVLDQIDADPESWSQETWDCGTTACFAGWAVRLAGGISDHDASEPEVVQGPAELIGMSVEAAAHAVLGISDGQAGWDREDSSNWLFHERRTRADLGRLVAEIFGPRPGGAA